MCRMGMRDASPRQIDTAGLASADTDGSGHSPAWLIGPLGATLSDVGQIIRSSSSARASSVGGTVRPSTLGGLEIDDQLELWSAPAPSDRPGSSGRRLHLSLVETRRTNGKVPHEHIASLGSLEISQTIKDPEGNRNRVTIVYSAAR